MSGFQLFEQKTDILNKTLENRVLLTENTFTLIVSEAHIQLVVILHADLYC